MSKSLKKTYKHPKTPDEIAHSLIEWYDNGQEGLETFTRQACPEAADAARYWFEKGRARFVGLAEAVRALGGEVS